MKKQRQTETETIDSIFEDIETGDIENIGKCEYTNYDMYEDKDRNMIYWIEKKRDEYVFRGWGKKKDL